MNASSSSFSLSFDFSIRTLKVPMVSVLLLVIFSLVDVSYEGLGLLFVRELVACGMVWGYRRETDVSLVEGFASVKGLSRPC